MTKFILLILISLLACNLSYAQKIRLKRVLNEAEVQTAILLANAKTNLEKDNGLVMPRTLEKGEIKFVKVSDWTSGFFPGLLWQLYSLNRSAKWKAEVDRFTQLLEMEKFNGRTHDMGFKINSSFGNGYRLTGENYYKEVILQSAKTLSARFNKKVGAIRSWDHSRDKWDFPVIIDNMMNLELLFLATRLSGDSSFYDIAVQHARTTLEHHYRPDYSSYHVVDFDTATGKVQKKNTHQGFADESAWARGQAWGLYGFTVCYAESGKAEFLNQAEHIAHYILNHPKLPSDLVPYWDYDDPAIPNVSRDASAAAITASALLKLSRFSSMGKELEIKARKMIGSLVHDYRSPLGENKGFLLLHSTGHAPAKSEVDAPINYADYYFLEALIRYKDLKKHKFVSR